MDEDDDAGDGINSTIACEHDADNDLDGVVAQIIILFMSAMAAGSMEHNIASDFNCEVVGGSSSDWISTSSSLSSMSSKSMESASKNIDNAIAARMLFGRGRYGECKT